MKPNTTKLTEQIGELTQHLDVAKKEQDAASERLAGDPANAEARGALQQKSGRVAAIRDEIALLESVRNHALRLDESSQEAERKQEAQRMLNQGAKHLADRLRKARDIDKLFAQLKEAVDEWARLTTEAKSALMAAKRLSGSRAAEISGIATTLRCINTRLVSQIDWATKSLEISKAQLDVEYQRVNPYAPDLVAEDVETDNKIVLRAAESVTGMKAGGTHGKATNT